jgi:hypothetical protein
MADEPKRRRSGRDRTRATHARGRDRYEQRIKRYGVAAKDIFPDDLAAPPDGVLHLSSERGQTEERGFVTLRPRSIDDVKSWIGVPDDVARQRQCAPDCPPAVSLVGGPTELRNLTQPQLRGLYRLGETYVHGDSRLAAPFRETLNYLVVDAVIIGIFVRKDLDVFGLLEIGADVKILFARHIRIWPRGKIRFLGNSKIDCQSIEGVQIVELPPWLKGYVPPIGRLTPLEVEHA